MRDYVYRVMIDEYATHPELKGVMVAVSRPYRHYMTKRTAQDCVDRLAAWGQRAHIDQSNRVTFPADD